MVDEKKEKRGDRRRHERNIHNYSCYMQSFFNCRKKILAELFLKAVMGESLTIAEAK